MVNKWLFVYGLEEVIMNKHVEKAMEIRNETPMVNNCAQTILRSYADELGITRQSSVLISVEV